MVQQELAPKVLRFHVRANGDRPEDQQIKMEVKNAVLSYLNPLLQNSKSVQETKKIVQDHLKEVQAVAEQMLAKYTVEKQKSDVRVNLKNESFPQKTYGDCTFPAGNYEALVIELGSGKGQNWWCMLYPALCFVDETCGIIEKEKQEELKTNLSEDAYHWMKEEKNRKITFRLTWLRKILEFPI